MVLLLLVTVCVGHVWQTSTAEPWHGDVTFDDHTSTVLWPLEGGRGDRGWGDGVERVTVTGRIEQVQPLTSNAGPLVEWYLRPADQSPRRVLLVAVSAPDWSPGTHVAVEGVQWKVEAVRGRDGVVRQIPTILGVDVVLGGSMSGEWVGTVWLGAILGLGVVVVGLITLGKHRGRTPALIAQRLSSTTSSDDDSGIGSLADDPAEAMSQMHDRKVADS